MIVYAGWPEYWELMWLRSVLNPNDAILDIGANVGHFSLLLSDIVSDPSRMIAIEPGRVAYERLQRNWRLNGFHVDSLVQAAAGATPGEVQIPSTDTPLTTLRVVESSPQGAPSTGPGVTNVTEWARMVTVDSLRAKWAGCRLGLMKIDVEGYEEMVLIGATTTLSLDRPRVVMFESLDGQPNAGVLRVLAQAHYVVFGLDGDGRPARGALANQNLFAVPIEEEESSLGRRSP